MSVEIIYKKKSPNKKSSNHILFVDEKFDISSLKKHILGTEYSFISDLIKIRDLKKRIFIFDIS